MTQREVLRSINYYKSLFQYKWVWLMSAHTAHRTPHTAHRTPHTAHTLHHITKLSTHFVWVSNATMETKLTKPSSKLSDRPLCVRE